MRTQGDFTVWTAEAEDGKARYFAVFNLGETRGAFAAPWQELGVAGERHRVRDLWLRQDLGKATGLKIELGPHASALFQVSVP